MVDNKEALGKFIVLASGAPLSNVMFGKPQEYFQDLCRVAIRALKRQQWISVEEKEPTYQELVLVIYDNGHITTDFMLSDGSWGLIQNPEARITHWKPLPESPKEVSND